MTQDAVDFEQGFHKDKVMRFRCDTRMIDAIREVSTRNGMDPSTICRVALTQYITLETRRLDDLEAAAGVELPRRPPLVRGFGRPGAARKKPNRGTPPK